MKKLVTIFDINNLEKLSEFADGFLVGNESFSARLTKSFSIDEVNTIIKQANDLNKEVFLNVNQMFTDQQLDVFKEQLLMVNTDGLTGIIVADLGTMILLESMGLNNKVVYNPETLLTNEIDFNFLSSNNILGAYIAKEITVEEVISIGKNKKYQMFMVGHGHLNMFYSKRYLLDNYSELINKADSYYTNSQTLKIVEPKRADSPFPILQDEAGTHVFRSKVMNSFPFFNDLSSVVDYFIIDTIFKDDNYGYEILKMYSNCDLNQADALKVKYDETWDEGFLNNKTYYKRKVK